MRSDADDTKDRLQARAACWTPGVNGAPGARCAEA
jgi:hypothetical protein